MSAPVTTQSDQLYFALKPGRASLGLKGDRKLSYSNHLTYGLTSSQQLFLIARISASAARQPKGLSVQGSKRESHRLPRYAIRFPVTPSHAAYGRQTRGPTGANDPRLQKRAGKKSITRIRPRGSLTFLTGVLFLRRSQELTSAHKPSALSSAREVRTDTARSVAARGGRRCAR